MTPGDLLGHARQALTAGVPQAARIAAVLTRQALEDIVAGLLPKSLAGAKMRSRLISLHVIVSPDAANLAAVAWYGLSRADRKSVV